MPGRQYQLSKKCLTSLNSLDRLRSLFWSALPELSPLFSLPLSIHVWSSSTHSWITDRMLAMGDTTPVGHQPPPQHITSDPQPLAFDPSLLYLWILPPFTLSPSSSLFLACSWQHMTGTCVWYAYCISMVWYDTIEMQYLPETSDNAAFANLGTSYTIGLGQEIPN